ncbi:MAG TPA: hypothetical protein PKD86_15340 [Gemmatales bacterium]|mgnify:CR=1 FL=1|nr:hypothetical protein [Gemmatales bacterium]HMP60718.1 hypothetical protein [Gemmatales bacterium]
MHLISSPCRWLALSLFVLAAALPAGAGQDGDGGGSFSHEESRSRLVCPKTWVMGEPKVVNRMTAVQLRLPPEGVEASCTWSPLIEKMEDAVTREFEQLQLTYGKDRVTRQSELTVKNKPVYVFAISDGPSRDVPDRAGKEAGIVYLAEAGPDETNRWKIRIRATVPKKTEDAGLRRVRELLEAGLEW